MQAEVVYLSIYPAGHLYMHVPEKRKDLTRPHLLDDPENFPSTIRMSHPPPHPLIEIHTTKCHHSLRAIFIIGYLGGGEVIIEGSRDQSPSCNYRRGVQSSSDFLVVEPSKVIFLI